MAHKAPIIVIGNGLTAKVMCVALDYFDLEYARLIPSKNDFEDARTTTINLASKKMLSNLDLWSFSAVNSTEIRDILVSQKIFGKDCFYKKTGPFSLRFSLDEKPMAWTIENNSLLESCYKLNSRSPAQTFVYEEALHFDYSPESVKIKDTKGEEWKAELLVACDGANSPTRKATRLRTNSLAANQKAIICRINLNQNHNNRAFQRFLPDGPIAVMPIGEKEGALVWSLTDSVADTILNMNEREFIYQVKEALGEGFYKISLNSERTYWPLNPSVTRSMGQPGLLLAGDSSHSVHPLAGMGFNLALADIAVICDCLNAARNTGLSFSHPSILAEYKAKRWAEIEAIIGVTQGLNRLFSYKSFQRKILPVGILDLGLSAFDMLPIKKQISHIATGGFLTSASLFLDM